MTRGGFVFFLIRKGRFYCLSVDVCVYVRVFEFLCMSFRCLYVVIRKCVCVCVCVYV